MEQEKVCRETWAKPVLDGKYPNIKYFTYYGGCQEQSIDEENHTIKCTSDDGLFKTFEKTIEAMTILKDKYSFDYLFRTNTSTYINVGLLNAFIDTLNDDKTVWCGELYDVGLPCPLGGMIYPRGNSVIFSHNIVDVILGFSKYTYCPSENFADDNLIGNILNTYHLLRFEDYKAYLKSYGFAWYSAIPDGTMDWLGNGLSTWNNTNISYDYLKNFISIQVRSYTDRSNENDKLRDLYEVLGDGKADYTEEIKFITDYSHSPMYYKSVWGTNFRVYEKMKY